MIGLLAAARLQTRTVAFEVLRPPNPDYRQLISEMTMPVVLVIGDATVVTLETARDLQSLNPRVSVEQIRDAGHGLPYDQPDRLAAVVSSFMRSTFPSGFDRRRSRV
jgi:pimeloyl-ACP methyl ester carboxylesterase